MNDPYPLASGREAVLSVFDDGFCVAAEAQARDRAAVRAVAAGDIRRAVLRFCRCRPAALLGRHQWPEKELRLGYCREQGIAVVRRLSGGGALYVDEGQLAWSLVLPRASGDGRPDLATLLERACRGVARGLARLGVKTRFKAPNDLEVAGRKLAGCHVAVEPGAVLLHGTVLMTADVERMLHALRVPTEKLSPKGLDGARRRLVTLAELLDAPPETAALREALVAGLSGVFGLEVGHALSASPAPPASAAEVPMAEDAAVPAAGAKVAESFWACGGGLLRARLWFDSDEAGRTRVARAVLGGDVTVHPADLFARLAHLLEGLAVEELRARLAAFFATEEVELLGFGPRDLARVLQRALARLNERRAFGIAPEQANSLMVHGPERLSAQDIAKRASVMLVPYCAKLPACKWRRRNRCTECGLCEVGEAYRLARERGLRVVSINNYEHLCRTLDELKRDGVAAYLGMCCSQFYVKRNRAFRDAGIPAVLMDVSGANCYELHQEEQAYAGTFEAKSELDIPLLERIMGAGGEETP
jgi:lipoate-protein ligase A